MLCKSRGIDLERGDPEVLREGGGEGEEDSAHIGAKREREWQDLRVGMQTGNPGGAGMLLWLKVLNEGTHMFHLNWREQQNSSSVAS